MAKKSPKKPTKAKAAAKKKSPAKHCCGVIITYACPRAPHISKGKRRSPPQRSTPPRARVALHTR